MRPAMRLAETAVSATPLRAAPVSVVGRHLRRSRFSLRHSRWSPWLPEWRLRVEPFRSCARAGGSGIGASRPLRRIPAIVSFLNPQPALSLVGGNRSSCPKCVIREHTVERQGRVEKRHS
jgi:hypothetical protein